MDAQLAGTSVKQVSLACCALLPGATTTTDTCGNCSLHLRVAPSVPLTKPHEVEASLRSHPGCPSTWQEGGLVQSTALQTFLVKLSNQAQLCSRAQSMQVTVHFTQHQRYAHSPQGLNRVLKPHQQPKKHRRWQPHGLYGYWFAWPVT